MAIKEKWDSEVRLSAQPTDAADYGRQLIKYKWLIGLLVVSASAASVIVGTFQVPIYRTSSTVLLSPKTAGLFSTYASLNQVIGSDALLAKVISQAKLRDTPDELRGRVQAEPVNSTRMIVITVTDSRRGKISRINDLVASEFIKLAEEQDVDQRAMKKQLRSIELQLEWVNLALSEETAEDNKEILNAASINKQIDMIKGSLANTEKADLSPVDKTINLFSLNQQLLALEGAKQGLLSERLDLLNQRFSLTTQKQDLLSKMENEQPTRLLTPAVPPTEPISPNTVRNVLLSMIAALVAGVSLAVFLTPREPEGTS